MKQRATWPQWDLQLFASGAGQNRAWTSNMLPIVAGPSDVAAAATVDSGAVLLEAVALTKYTFAIVANTADALANWQVQILGCNDRRLYYAYQKTLGSPTQAADLVTSFPYSWVPLPGPSEQSGTGGIANPMTVTIPFFQYSGDLVAVRAIASQVGGTATGYIRVTAEAVP